MVDDADGTVSLVDGAVVFTPADGFTGLASFDYTITDGTDTDTATATVQVQSVIEGTAGSDTLTGTSANENIYGLEGNDTLVAGAGRDTLIGGPGDDQLVGDVQNSGRIYGPDGEIVSNWTDADYSDATDGVTVTMSGASGTSESTVTGDESVGTDTLTNIEDVRGSEFADTYTVVDTFRNEDGSSWNKFEGRGGDDVITGNGNTALDYGSADAGVTVDLDAGTGQSTDADDAAGVGVDTFTGVHDVRGSRYDDTLTGDDANNSFRGRQGDDYIDGGDGTDRADYRTSPSGVTVDLSSANESGEVTVSDGYGTTDTLVSIESIKGSDFADTLIGDDGRNYFRGQAGDDYIDGGADEDTADYYGAPGFRF